MIKRILTLILALSILAVSVLSCSCALFKGPISDEELRGILTELLPQDALLNRCIWGEEIKPNLTPEVDDENAYSPIYYTVSSDSPFHSVEQMKKEVEAVYSSEISEIINEYAFESNDIAMSRFCDDVDDKGNVLDLRIDVTHNHNPYKLTTTAYISSAVVRRSTRYMIEAKIEFTSGESQTRREMKIRLLKEGESWKIDSQTWISRVEN